jgi:hypothetical protein
MTEQPGMTPTHIIKFADDATVVGLITDNDETAYRGGQRPDRVVQGQQPLPQCDQDKEMIVDYRKRRTSTPKT